MIRYFYFAVVATLLPFGMVSQTPVDVSGNVQAEVFISSGLPAPMWFTAREEGRWGLIDRNQFLTSAQANILKKLKGGWSFTANVEMDYNSAMNRAYLHHGFLKTEWQFLSLTAGRHTFAPIFESKYSGSGSYLFGDNYRPIDRITVEMNSYTAVPLTRGLIEVRGGVSHGWLDDTQHNRILATDANYYHNQIFLHEKYAYARLNMGRWKPYGGLNHSVFMGGYDRNGRKVPIDYWNSIFAKSSAKIGGGDATNAGGAHMGLYDFGMFMELADAQVQFYYQIPFTDKSGMLFWKRNYDQMAGLNINFKSGYRLLNLTFEWTSTAHQTGNSVPDAIVVWPDGQTEGMPRAILINKSQQELDELMHRLLGDAAKTGYTFNEVNNYLRDTFNKGRPHGGRDGYMNNGVYPGGWTFYGMVMGSPLNITRDRLHHLNPVLGKYTYNFIASDRYRALHAGGDGHLTRNLLWQAKLTFAVNYGSYYNQYPGRYTWEETANYYFATEKKQLYSHLALAWKPRTKPNFTLSAAVAFDTGEMFNTFGAKTGIKWSF